MDAEADAAELTMDVKAGPETVLTVAGDLDLAAAPSFVAGIDSLFAERRTSVVLDLAGVTFLDSSGLGAMLSLHARCQAEGVPLSAINAPKQVGRVLELTNLTELFQLR